METGGRMQRREPGPLFLTTREVATLLRIKERKVYELVAEKAIPVSRATGKLLFPRDMIDAWIRRHVVYRENPESLVPRPVVFAGSHDPLLDWALRESGSEIATFFDGSRDGLSRLAAGRAIGAGIHLIGENGDDWNIGHVDQYLPGAPVVVLEWARRRQGLVLPLGNPHGIRGVADLAGRRVIGRQEGAGARVLLDGWLSCNEGVSVQRLDPPARSETDVAVAVSDGKADAGVAIEGVARQYRLDFVPLLEERYDLVLWRQAVFEPSIQALLTFARTAAFSTRAKELGGYDLTGHGRIHHNGP